MFHASCARQWKPVYRGSQLSPVLCGIIWSRLLCPSSTQATQPACPSYFRLSLPAAFPRNGHGWSTPRRSHCSHICQQQILDKVCEQLSIPFFFVIYFPLSIFFLWRKIDFCLHLSQFLSYICNIYNCCAYPPPRLEAWETQSKKSKSHYL